METSPALEQRNDEPDSGSSDDDEEAELDFEQKKTLSIYNAYRPSVFFENGNPHPQRICEAETLSWVNPPKLTYTTPKLPAKLFKKIDGENPPLSIPQMEAILLACDSHSKFLVDAEFKTRRRGFLIGDGTGLGKGRIISGIIVENWIHKRKKSVWISASSLLADSCKYEMKLLKPELPFIEFANSKEDKISQDKGVCFLTYSALSDEAKFSKLKNWLGFEFDGVIAFDECHLAKSFANPAGLRKKTTKGGEEPKEKLQEGSKIGAAVVKLQEIYPLARIVYSSATAASEIHHLLYMQRLGIWGRSTCFVDEKDFYKALEKRGTAALELLCIELKMKGVLLARQISYEGVDFVIKGDKRPCSDFEEMYRRCTLMWLLILRYVHESVVQKDKTLVLRSFWAQNQRFFSSLIVTGKLKRTVELAKKFDKENSMIFGLQHTGEAQYDTFLAQKDFTENQPYSYAEYALRSTLESLDVKLGFDATFNATVSSQFDDAEKPSKISKTNFLTWPTNCIGSFSNKSPKLLKWSYSTCQDRGKLGLIQLFHELRPLLPLNPLDDLIDRLGGHSKVSELTGRKYSQARNGNIWKKDTRSRTEDEYQQFMSLKKNFVVISDVSSVGFSLHADKKCVNTKTRYHFTCEHAWIPEKAVQQLGRSHRSEQKQCPVYVFVQSPVAAEARIIQSVAKKLCQMGAITHAESKINQLREGGATGEIFSTLGEKAVKTFISNIMDGEMKNEEEMLDYFKQLGILDLKKNMNVKRFLNRIMVMPLSYQKKILDNIDQIMANSRSRGVGYDSILEFPDAGKNCTIKHLDSDSFMIQNVSVNLHRFDIDRTCDWETVKFAALGKTCKFLQRASAGSVACVFQIAAGSKNYEAIFPWNRNKTPVTASILAKLNYEVVNSEEAERIWTTEYSKYQQNPANCLHIVKFNQCRFVDGCDYQWGRKFVHLIVGGVHGVWDVLEKLFKKKVNLARVTYETKKFIGVYVEQASLNELKAYLHANDPNMVPDIPNNENVDDQDEFVV